MHRWTPPKGSKVVFRLDAVTGIGHPGECRSDEITYDQRDRLVREFHQRFEIKSRDQSFTTVRLDDPRWPEMLDEIEDLTARGLIGLRWRGACWIDAPKPRASDKNVWVNLDTGPLMLKNPRQAPGGRELLWRKFDGTNHAVIDLASERFRRAVSDAGLTGLDFLPLPDWDGWYQVWATSPLGRGLDHPLIDPEKRKRKHAKHKRPNALHTGEPTAWLRLMWDDAFIDHPVARRLVGLGNPDVFRVSGVARFVRECLPQTDFAYRRWSSRKEPPPTWLGRSWRDICCNTRARKALIDAGVMRPRDFSDAVVTVAAEDASAEILDRTVPHPLPLPTFTPEEAQAECLRREIVRAARPPAPPEAAPCSLAEAAERLEAHYADTKSRETPLRGVPALNRKIRSSRLFAKLPTTWQQIVHLLPVAIERAAGPEPFGMTLTAPTRNDWLADPEDARLDPDNSPSRKDIVVARSPIGDWFAIRSTDPQLPTNARVTWWDHETLTPQDVWPTVEEFVGHILTVMARTA